MNLQSEDWLAMYDVMHHTEFETFATQERAKMVITAGEGSGECYGIAIYHIPTKTLYMHDPLGMCDSEKVRSGIEDFLKQSVSCPTS